MSVEIDGTLYPALLVVDSPRGPRYLDLTPREGTLLADRINAKKDAALKLTPELQRAAWLDPQLFLKPVYNHEASTHSPFLPLFPTVFDFNSPYSQALINSSLSYIHKGESALVLGSGAGVDALMVAHHTGSAVDAVDINPIAVANTQATALMGKKENQIHAWQSDLFSETPKRYDTIIFNAPLAYTPEIYARYGRSPDDFRRERPQLVADPNTYDPDAALLKRLLAEAPRHLRPGGRLYLMTHADLSQILPDNLVSQTIHRFKPGVVEHAIHEIRVKQP
jgi:SAM-dependent methyltransferase